LKLDISKHDRPCIIDGKVADISQLIAMSPEATPQEVVGHKPTATPQDLERIYNAPSANHEAEHEVSEAIETSSSIGELQQAFPTWKPKSLEVASVIVDWLRRKSDESFPAHAIRSGIAKIKTDPNLPSDRLKKLLDVLTTQGFLAESEGKYSAIQASDDYDF
ncbi:hypothetical protein H6F89_28605, partial [Cyanobacteria bacterium FACHB-63]|nr:hypothetical protein [Cyanobacteria bacterium FACHB-63]